MGVSQYSKKKSLNFNGNSWWVDVSVFWSVLFDLCFVSLFVALQNTQGGVLC